ncbi:hypothetical protein MAR_003082, partial [Mya arenaria]
MVVDVRVVHVGWMVLWYVSVGGCDGVGGVGGVDIGIVAVGRKVVMAVDLFLDVVVDVVVWVVFVILAMYDGFGGCD